MYIALWQVLSVVCIVPNKGGMSAGFFLLDMAIAQVYNRYCCTLPLGMLDTVLNSLSLVVLSHSAPQQKKES